MNAIFQALAYVPSVRKYSVKHYLKEQYVQLYPGGATEKVFSLFHEMYTGKYKMMFMGGKRVRTIRSSYFFGDRTSL